MQEYLLFVDTETSGLPVDWRRPYSAAGNWPHIAQLAWAVYTPDGQLVKTENHYLRVPAAVMSPVSVGIHGLTPEFLQAHGQEAPTIMQLFHDDLRHYRPLVVGHFMKLDFHMVGAEFYRAGLPNLLDELPTFCTMTVTARFVRHTLQRYLPLGELYQRLFDRPLLHQHDAAVDAHATAECFFELWRHGDVDEAVLAAQPPLRAPTASSWRDSWPRVVLLGGAALLILFLLWHWLYG